MFSDSTILPCHSFNMMKMLHVWEVEMTICLECGNDLRKGAKFCDICGSKVKNENVLEDPFLQASISPIEVQGKPDPVGYLVTGIKPENLGHPNAPALMDYRVIGFILVAGLLMVLGVFTPMAKFGVDSYDYWPNILYLFLACVCLVFAFIYKRTKR
jgi:hypothetical protein